MSAIAITAANVLASAQAVKSTGTTAAGVSITAGQTLYKLANGTIGLYDANGTAPANVLEGIALHASLAGQPITYVKRDPAFQFGGTVAIGDVLIGGAAAPGDIAPIADKASTWFVTDLGPAISTTKIKFAPNASGVAV